MKKLLLTLACAMTSLFASAQAKTAAVGLNLNYGTEIESLGLGVKGSYCFTDHIRGEASFKYTHNHKRKEEHTLLFFIKAVIALIFHFYLPDTCSRVCNASP